MNLISSWIENKIFAVHHSGHNDHKERKNTLLNLSVIEAILKNAVIDFDWETRLSCVHILLVIIQTHAEKSANFCCKIFDFIIFKSLFDTEIKVQEKALQCLHKLQYYLKPEIEIVEERQKISIMEEFKIYLEEYQKDNKKWCIETLRHFVSLFDFIGLIENLKPMDDHVQNDAVSFMDDILSSVHQKDENLLIDCY